MKRKSVYPDAPIFLEATRSIGYSFEAAVADVIDNSISKNAKNISVIFDSNNPMYLAILDNGSGIASDEIENVMRYGSRSSLDTRDSNDLGRFGLGLKTASLSQCRLLSVVSKIGDNIVCAEWNLDLIEDWSLIIYEPEECETFPGFETLKAQESGTLVVWRNYDRFVQGTVDPSSLFDKKIEVAKKHVALVFHRFLEPEMGSKRIKISFNGEILLPIDPFMTNNPATQYMEESLIAFKGEFIKVKPFILPFTSKLSIQEKDFMEENSDLKLTQGFYVYRNKRLIIWGTWLRLLKQEELKRLARVRIDIPNNLDSFWDIDIKKSTAALPEDIKDQLKKIVFKATDRSENVFRYRGRKAVKDNLEHVWNVVENRGHYSYLINKDTELFKAVQNSITEEGASYFNSLIKTIESTFPFRDVYFRFAKTQDKETEPIKSEISEDELLAIGADYIELEIKSGKTIQEAFLKARKFDFLVSNPAILDKLEKLYELKC